MKPFKFNRIAVAAAISLTAFASLSLITRSAHADNLDSELNSLGGNPSITERARELQPDDRMEVVENRTVDRNWRLELGFDYGMLGGGDSYVNSQGIGANADLHIDPHWSIGARYFSFFNSLTPEGQRIAQGAGSAVQQGAPGTIASFSYPLDTTLGVVSFYPLYGKLNMFDMGVTQFDLYVLGGAGEITTQAEGLSAYSAPTWTAGGGVGFWWTQHFASRLEVRYQGYQDKILGAGNVAMSRAENAIITTATVGFLL